MQLRGTLLFGDFDGVLISTLRNLCVLCDSAVICFYRFIYRRDAEDAEITQSDQVTILIVALYPEPPKSYKIGSPQKPNYNLWTHGANR